MLRVKDLITFIRTQPSMEFEASNGVRIKMSVAGDSLWFWREHGSAVTGDDIEDAIKEALSK